MQNSTTAEMTFAALARIDSLQERVRELEEAAERVAADTLHRLAWIVANTAPLLNLSSQYQDAAQLWEAIGQAAAREWGESQQAASVRATSDTADK